MTRRHNKRAHANSRRSRNRHEEATGLQVMLGRMFALKVQCDLSDPTSGRYAVFVQEPTNLTLLRHSADATGLLPLGRRVGDDAR